MKNIHSTTNHMFFAQVFLFAIVMVMSWNVHSVFAIAAPSGLSASCGFGGTSVNVYWTPVSGSTAQAIRFDGATPSWNAGACTTMNAGDLCQDLGASVNQSYQKISPDVSYLWWVHAIDAGGWSGASSGTFNCPATYTLTVNKTANGGTVTSSDGISCPLANSTCSKSSTSNANVTLTPTAASGFVFSSWSGCDSVASGTNICTVMMSGSRTVTANFVAASANYTLSIGKTGSGSVVSNPAGINCTGTDAAASNPTACTKNYLSGTAVTLTATPISGQTFVGWSGPCNGTGTCTVTMDANKNATANFSTFPPPPSNLAPTCVSDGTSVTYTWTGATGATGYAVRMDVNPDSFDTSTCASGGYGANGDYCKDNIGNTTSVTLTTAPNVVHNFWVQSRGSSGEWGGSVVRTNITCASAAAPNPPTNLTASCAAGGASVNLGWNSVSGAASYALRADKNPSTWSDVWWANSGNCTTAGYFTTALDTSYSGGVGDYCQNGLTSTSKTLSIAPDTNYLWWVHTVSGTGVWSATSQSVNVNCPSVAPVVPSTPTGLNPSAGCVALTPKVDLAWNGVSGATSYDMQWCSGGGCTPNTLISGISTNVYAHTNRTAGIVYGYRVRATNSAGSSVYSATQYATAQSCAAAAPRLIICPAAAPSITVGKSTNLEARYWANLALVPDCTTGSYNTVTGSATWGSSNNGLATVSSGGVVTGVAAGSPNITATYSGLPAVKSVTVTAPSTPTAPTGLTATPDAACGSGQINVSWNSVAGASGYDLQIDGSPTWTSLGNVLTYTHTGLANSSSHTYRVRAWNGVGAGVASGLVNGTAPAVCAAPSCTGLQPSNATACSLTDPGVTIPYGIVPACLMTATKCHYICNQGYIEVGASCVPTQCNDGVDNDADTLVDLATDPGCANINDNAESNLAPDLTVDKRLVEQGGNVVLTYYPNGQTCTLSGGGLNMTNLTSDGSTPSQTISGRTTFTLSCPTGNDTVTVEVVPRGWES